MSDVEKAILAFRQLCIEHNVSGSASFVSIPEELHQFQFRGDINSAIRCSYAHQVSAKGIAEYLCLKAIVAMLNEQADNLSAHIDKMGPPPHLQVRIQKEKSGAS